ncbi:MAG: NUDIX domain-containing protein [Candidatus Saccharibacteria bacterium]|nr:NUDIX domain-containing protein [Candidatus Saccharibacteria bacterium]
MHKDEMWQLYYPNGEPIPGAGWDSAKNNPSGTDAEIVGVAVVFLYRKNAEGEIELLWQKRSKEIDRYPGDFDISAGGHVNLGESTVAAAVRETREEIGVDISAEDLSFVTMRPFNKNRFAWIYAVNWRGRADEFSFDDKEVSEVKWVPFKDTKRFRKWYAKAPLKKDDLTFECLEEWFKMHGYL